MTWPTSMRPHIKRCRLPNGDYVWGAYWRKDGRRPHILAAKMEIVFYRLAQKWAERLKRRAYRDCIPRATSHDAVRG